LPGANFLRGFLALLGLCGVAVLLVLPLGWKEQAIVGAVLILLAVLLNVSSRSAAVTVMLMTISVFSTLRYGYWRVTQTWEGITSSRHLHQWNTVFVVLLLLAEAYAFATLILGYFQTLRPLRRRPVPLTGDARTWPSVDVFIPTYNEPLDVVRATVLASLSMEYPAGKMNVFILDDGRREEFRDFALQVGAEYISRSNNTHAKAGNINHALKQTSGDYIAIFDSDHAPTRSFLQVTLGWFLQDHQLGMVQTPHHFYSPDPFERNLNQFRKIPNEGELFHRLVQDGNDLWNASFFCGSCAVLRRDALNEIGGIAVETVTEDAHTALRMQRRGWNTAYINIPQAAGLATESLAAHIGQRVRWARGMIQILRLENPLFTSGLTPSQRLCYFNATTHFLFALPRLIFLTIPLVYLLFGMVNIYGYSLAVFAYALPHIILSNLTSSRIQGKHRFSFWNEIYEAVLAPYILLPTLLALINPRLGKFNVTAKGGIVRRSYFDRRIALPLLLLLMLNGAGLYKAHQRYVADPAHHDTVIMNSAWAVYNIVILAVAASVAWERRQRRSEVRVDLRVPFTLQTERGQRVVGMTTQVSLRGASGKLDRSVRLARGTAVSLVLGTKESACQVQAIVAHSAGRRQHLLFPSLTLSQEEYLVNLVYSRPDAWVSWRNLRMVDRPLYSLLQIVWLAMRAIIILPLGLVGLLPTSDRGPSQQARRKERNPALASIILVFFWLFVPVRLQATDTTAENPHPAAVQPVGFHEEYDLAAPAPPNGFALHGPGASQNFYFSVPVMKIISSATLKLHYAAPMLHPNEASLELSLNGTLAGRVGLMPGTDTETDIILPTDLLTTDNTLVLQLVGSCSGCAHSKDPWVKISGSSPLSFSGTKLPLANDLSLLPIPFFDPAGRRPWSLAVVFAERPDVDAVKAAALVASWFGVFSDVRGARFPVKVGEFPDGNAVVLVLRNSEMAAKLALPPKPGALLAMRDNPRDPYGKLLVLGGDSTKDLLAAAHALITRDNHQAHTDAAYIRDVTIPTRRQYDAPRWLKADAPASIGTYTTENRFELRGSGSVNVYFRLPPDLFLQARQSVPLLLKYTYTGVEKGSQAAIHIRLNDKDVDSILLKPTDSQLSESAIARLPTGSLRSYANTLTVDFDFGHSLRNDNVRRYAAIHRDSWIDLRGIPHSVILPRLELFADAGYPYTEWPDLGRTAVVLPDAPTRSDYETLFDMAAFWAAQTGCPATALAVTDPANVGAVADKDLVLLGTATTQPLLRQWAENMPLSFVEGRMRAATEDSTQSRLLHLNWPFRDDDRARLAWLAASGRSMDVVVEDFVSPFRADRSVVAIVPQEPDKSDSVAALFVPSERQGPVYGGVAIARDGRFQSFLVGNLAYRSGDLDPYQQTLVFLLEDYWLVPLFVVVLAFPITVWLRHRTERVAAQRLAVGRN
jgi:cellulose synthase (UDP-forming)